MKEKKDRYGEVTGMLKNSKPVLRNPGEIENNVMRTISNIERNKAGLTGIIETIYGWVYVGWIRRSLVAASVLLVGLFVFQQSIIIRKISNLEQKSNYTLTSYPVREYDLYSGSVVSRMAGIRSLRTRDEISVKELEKLLDSYNDLKIKYEDILRTIEDDPELKKYFNDKLPGFDRDKTKL